MEICLRRIRKSFLDSVALDNIDLDVESGQLIAVVGTNGAGNSHLINANRRVGRIVFGSSPGHEFWSDCIGHSD